MAGLVFIKYFGPVLFVVILQATKISALQCYQCSADAHEDCLEDDLPDDYLVTAASWLHQNPASADLFVKMFKDSKIKMTQNKGPFCVKYSPEHPKKGNPVVRGVARESVASKNLDIFGCMRLTGGSVGEICFCQRDYCNKGLATSPTLLVWVTAFLMLARKLL